MSQIQNKKGKIKSNTALLIHVFYKKLGSAPTTKSFLGFGCNRVVLQPGNFPGVYSKLIDVLPFVMGFIPRSHGNAIISLRIVLFRKVER